MLEGKSVRIGLHPAVHIHIAALQHGGDQPLHDTFLLHVLHQHGPKHLSPAAASAASPAATFIRIYSTAAAAAAAATIAAAAAAGGCCISVGVLEQPVCGRQLL